MDEEEMISEIEIHLCRVKQFGKDTILNKAIRRIYKLYKQQKSEMLALREELDVEKEKNLELESRLNQINLICNTNSVTKKY